MKRSGMVGIGIVVALLGIAGLVFESIPYDREQATMELGSIEASAAVQEEAEVPPLLAGAVLALGIGMIAVGATRS